MEIVFSEVFGGLGGGFLENADVVENGRTSVDIFDGVKISDFGHFNVIRFFDS